MQNNIYKIRRDDLLELVDDAIIIISASDLKIRSNDTEYPFRQDSNFYYLTGFLEDNAFLVLTKIGKNSKSFLFVEKKVPEMELWSGKRLGVDAAKEEFTFSEIYDSSAFTTQLDLLMNGCKNLYCDIFNNDSLFSKIRESSKRLQEKRDVKISPQNFKNSNILIEKMRLVKSDNEVALIKKAIDITKFAHHSAMKKVTPNMREYALQAEYEYSFKKSGAYSDAYTTIIAGGENANTLHYIKNSDVLQSGDLVLVDAGCEYQMYASDITRTFPVNGKFSDAQKELYEMVLDVQIKVINYIKVGVTKSELQALSEKLLTEGMIKLGILQGSLGNLLDSKACKKYYPHGIGHHLGLDVHDRCPYFDENGKELQFIAGIVFTVEPGIYLPQDDKTIPSKYRGIGIRIEDDILVTQDGNINLSKDIVKSVKEIESLMKYS